MRRLIQSCACLLVLVVTTAVPAHAKLIAKDLGVTLEMVPVTGPNRVPFLLSGKADMVVSIFGITPERAKSVAFSIPYGTLKAVIFLKGKRIGVARGNIMD